MTREEALKIVRENYPHFGTTEPWLDLEKALATLIPELRESEDERIRKGLIEVVSDIAGGWPFEEHRITKKEALAYLERQKEQKPEERFKEAREKYQVEWSEEDERIKSCICLALTDVNEQRFKGFGTTLKDCLAWVKDLHPSWKPSEEQMKVLYGILVGCRGTWGKDTVTTMELLYQDLKKLM